jgi:hypothetical protein
MLALLEVLNSKLSELDKEIARRAREDVIARRLLALLPEARAFPIQAVCCAVVAA